MYILGLNAYHADAAAALFKDGHLLGAVAEERLDRRKHCAGFPGRAIKLLLEKAGIGAAELDHVAVSRDPLASLGRKVAFVLGRGADSAQLVLHRLQTASRVRGLPETLAAALGVPTASLRARFHHVEHHRAHLASAFFMGGMEDAACLSIDGFGDFTSTMTAVGRRHGLEVLDRVPFPHSAGLFYTAVTQFLGFPAWGDEWKLMGLAPYGQPVFREQLWRLVRLLPRGRFELDLQYFTHYVDGARMSWEEGAPTLGRTWSDRLMDLLGPPRDPASGDYLGHWADIAASAQAVYEETLFHVLAHLHDVTGLPRLCLAGGCALNCVANGKIPECTPFRDVFIPPAPGDDGTALGAAAYVAFNLLSLPRQERMEHAFTGPEYGEEAVAAALTAADLGSAVTVTRLQDDALCRRTAQALADGRILGWFQGRMEFGPRALGNRSILADPRRADVKDTLNRRIKQREAFRPFALSVLEEAAPDVLQRAETSPFMLRVFTVAEPWRARIPAVTHVDHGARVQTVNARDNPRFHALIGAFRELTSVPVLLNTSFNEQEPIVMDPPQALACFARTRMDALVIGNHYLERRA
ncbi:MAG: carbamoyltransferase [Deltaproteobacteria bacterium]|nr:carbamoyltransferase [Deltaproteobacteria bacterium]